MMTNRLIIRIAMAAMAVAAAMGATSCSTTSRLEAGDVLYTGVKKVDYRQADSVKIDADVQDQIFEAINVKPNNPLYSPYYRTPLPIGLWVYNHWSPNSKGLKGWLYRKLASQPVLISRVRPEARVKMINTLLSNNGYFSSSAAYTLNYSSKNKRKASITYSVNVGKPYVIGHVTYLEGGTPLSQLIDSMARADSYLRQGKRYCLDSLNNTRINITNKLRDKGYYYFQPEYLQYEADSSLEKGVIDLRLVKSANIPNMAMVQYYTRRVTATVESSDGGGTPDTLQMRNCTLVKMMPVKIKDDLIPSCLSSKPGRPFKVGSMDRTQLRLSRLGIFNSINMSVSPVDSVTPEGNGLLDLDVKCALDKPLEVKFEVQGTSKSNSFIGPGLETSLTHKNLMGGGEQLSWNLNASYEWQTGKGSSYKNSDLNSYEFGSDVTLAIPRLLAPRFVDRSRRYLNWTRASLSASIMNRPNYFKMAQFGAKFSWEWHANKKSLNQFTPFKLTYSKVISKTAAFDSAMAANPAIAQSFKNTFIPEMEYSYTYDNSFGPNNITWSSTITEAGNLFAGMWAACGAKGTKRLFGTPFSQFIKAQTQLVWSRNLGGGKSLVSRVFLGAAHAYGNSSQVPYSEQFYIGGANSVRAFTVRTIGPGSYHPAEQSINAYYDQTGTFKFETNWELRFPILGYFKGAIFVDAGNVWLLKDDALRPGGQLKLKNFFDELAVGTGVGLRFDMSMLVVRADVGVGIHAPYDTGKRGYYNMTRFKDSLALHIAIGYPF